MKMKVSLAMAGAMLVSMQVQAETQVAYDMLDSGSLNLISHINPHAGTFSSVADGAEKYRRDLSSSIPFSVLDDSLRTYPGDNLGIVDDDNLHEFFGITDTDNSDNPGGVITAQWNFEIGNAPDLSLVVDAIAMGDFEAASDNFTWSASIDGDANQTLLQSSVDESTSQTYTLAGGFSTTLPDPMTLAGSKLDNTLQTFAAGIDGTGDVLTLTLTAQTDGGSETIVFQNLRIVSEYNGGSGPGDEDPELSLRRIHEIQGIGGSSPLAGQRVIVEAVVVGDFQNNSTDDSGNLDGFYLQEEDTDADGNSMSSEGVFVYDADAGVDVEEGDQVRVIGKVQEYSGLTEVVAEEIEVLSTGNALPAVVELTLPLTTDNDLEVWEGMRVNLSQSLVISEYYNYDRYGELVLAMPLPGEERLYTPTAVEIPGTMAYEKRLQRNELSQIVLDDGFTVENQDNNRHPNGRSFSLQNRFRGGDRVRNIAGILDQRFGLYRIQPTAGADYTVLNPRPASPPDVGGDIKVASFNVLNYFPNIDDGSDDCGPSMDMECRGADSTAEFIRQRDKILAALAGLNADVVGLIEIQNSPDAVESLVRALNDYLGAEIYAALSTGHIGTDAIKTGLIYKPEVVTALGEHAILDSSVDNRFVDSKNRPALAQTFTAEDGGRFTVVINHLKSKSSSCDDLADPDLGDGQGHCNMIRTRAAEALQDWLATDPTGSGDGDVLLLGDMNAYAKEDPITYLLGSGFTNLLQDRQGELAYSYVFDGQFGYLDHALASNSLAGQVAGAATWAINADEPDLLDYDTSYKSPGQADLYEPNAFRSSDHDPVLVGLDLNAPPACRDAQPSSHILWPPNHQFRAISIEGITDPDGDAVSIDIVDVEQKDGGRSRDKTSPDAMIGTGNLVQLRAERQGGGRAAGRVYTVHFTARSAGGQCSGSVAVTVPHHP